MGHFANEDWVDFVREVGNDEKRQKMDEHLNSGCETCRATLHFWEETNRNAAREASYQPPDKLLRTVKGMGALYLSRPTRSSFAALAELIMDSSRPAAVAGVRSNGIAPWLLLYKSGSVNIDLRIEQVPSSNRVSLVGQVLDLSKSNQMIAEVPVAVVFEGGEMEKTTTNEFGEFQLEFEPASQLYLTVEIAKRKEIWVPLNRSTHEHPQGIWF